MTGSDQVWHNWTNTKEELRYFFLAFAKPEQRLTIAPSFGRERIDIEELEAYREGLRGFETLTCREETGADLIQDLVGRKAHVILDPTMLIDTEHWRRMQKKPVMKLEDEFILVYSLGGLTGEVSQYIERVAKQHECKVLDMLAGRTKELYLARPDEIGRAHV